MPPSTDAEPKKCLRDEANDSGIGPQDVVHTKKLNPGDTSLQDDKPHTHDKTVFKGNVESAREFNRRLPVNKLPVEVLCIIFQCAASVEDVPHRRKTDMASTVASVCTHWRAVAIAFPGLWATLNLRRIPLHIATQYRQRAGLFPIRIEGCDISGQKVQDLVSSNMPRIKSLSIDMRAVDRATRAQILPTVQALTLGQHAQPLILESFTCMLPAYDDLEWSVPEAGLDLSLFGEQAPMLRHIQLFGLRMPWRRGFYRNLSSLTVRSCTIGPVPSHDEAVLHVLRDCPRLHSLTLILRQRGPDPPDDHLALAPAVSPKIVHLPHLQELRLGLPVRHLCHVLRYVELEFVQSLDIKVDEDTQGSAALALELPSLLPHGLLSHLDQLELHLSKHGPSHTGRILGASAKEREYKLSLRWTVSPHNGEAYNDAMVRRATQAWAPHMQDLVYQHLTLNDELRVPGVIPRAVYPLSPGLLIPSVHLHVADFVTSYVFTDEAAVIVPAEWPRMETMELTGDCLDARTMSDWTRRCRRLTESKHALRRWILGYSAAHHDDEEGLALQAEISSLGLNVVWLD